VINSTRREFLTLAAATTAALAGWRCGGQTGSQATTRTLFFDFRHETDADEATYHLIVGGRRHPLLRAHEQSGVLAQARQTNTFLRNVPGESVTHVIPSLISPGNEIQIGYVMKNRDLTSGLWSMTSMFFVIPLAAVRAAHQFVVQSGQPLTVSAKRMRYGLPAARTEQDFLEEEALADISDHATALISFHPEVLSGHPGSAAYIQKHLVQRNAAAFELSETIMSLKEALPEQVPGTKNEMGWATLVPYRDDDDQPLRADKGSNQGLILYNTEWHPTVQRQAGAAIKSVLQKAKDDTSLGADITSAIGGGARPPLDGTIWHRRDGITSVEQSGDIEAAQTPSSDALVITPSTPFAGYSCDATIAAGNGNPMVTLKLDNWYVRWLGIWVEFIGSNGPIHAADLTEPYFRNALFHTDTEVLLAALSPEWTIYGIPIEESSLSLTFPFPFADGATSAHVIASGLGIGSQTRADTIGFGEGLTVVFNLLVPTAMLALGAAQSLDPLLKTLKGLMQDQNLLVNAVTKVFLGSGDAGFIKSIGIIFGKALARQAAQIFLKRVVEEITVYVIADVLVDCIPIVGQIVEAIGALGTVATLAETSAEVATSPWTYESTLTPIHDVAVKIVPDTANGDITTPDGATVCVVTALFDSGATPRVVRKNLTAPVASIDVHYTGIPLGQNITVSAGFYQGSPDDPHHTLLGQATSGLVPNTMDTVPDLVIKRIIHPILPSTSYAHVRKTVLDPTDKHAWSLTTTAPAETQDPASGSNLCQNQAGSLCEFRGITVRQPSAVSRGFLGYAWHGFGTGCGGGSGDFDRLSNVNTAQDAAEDGYATVPCGLGSGARIAYSLLGQSDANFYVDPDPRPPANIPRLIRRVALGTTPSFDDPTSNQAWGQLNFASDALLLHPTGIIVSVSNANHRLETLAVPAAAVTDEAASTDLLANVHGGEGTRPGLLSFPIAAAVSPGGVILVLELGNNRIQAFDVGGNSVPFFKKLPDPHFLTLTATAVPNTNYLDMAVEHTGFIYVLSFNDGTSPFTYRLDIYSPDQSGTAPISTTQGFNAARIAVDFWRNVYALNYEVLKKQDGTLPELTEPSVSEWGPQG